MDWKYLWAALGGAALSTLVTRLYYMRQREDAEQRNRELIEEMRRHFGAVELSNADEILEPARQLQPVDICISQPR